MTASPRDTLESAEAALAAGELEVSARLFESATRASVANPPAMARALLGLGRSYGRSGRFFEAAVVARRLVRHERGRGVDGNVSPALGMLAAALLNAKASTRAEAVVDEFADSLASTPEEDAPELYRILYQARYSLALVAGDVDGAETHFARLGALLGRGLLGEQEAWLLRNGEFHLALARGDIESMEAISADVLAGDRQANVYVPEVTLRLGLARAYAQAGRLLDAREQASGVIEYLVGTTGASEVLIDDAANLALFLHRELGETDAALRAADLAAEALLERLRSIKESTATIADLMDPEDEGLLAGLREDFQLALLDFLREIRGLLRSAGRLDEDVGDADGTDPTEPSAVRLCAWCGAVRLTPGTWVPLRRLVRELPLGTVSHGICAACRAHAEWAGPSPGAE